MRIPIWRGFGSDSRGPVGCTDLLRWLDSKRLRFSRDWGDGEWDFDTEETTTIMKDAVSGFYDTTDLENTGLYEKLKNGMYAEVDESDFEYELASSEDDESESDVSLDDEEF